jgi:hypothetical protein
MTGMTYEEFGAAFVHEAVTPERISGVIRGLAGDVVKVGPLAAGPGGIASAIASGTISEPLVDVVSDDPLTYRVTLPVDLSLDLNVAGTHHHYTAKAKVRIGIAVHLEAPLSICITPTPPGRGDVSVKVDAKGIQAKVLGRIGDIDNELQKEIAAYVKSRISSDASEFSNVDLRPLMIEAWPTG